jgi:hypothetical protein
LAPAGLPHLLTPFQLGEDFVYCKS